MFLEQHGRTIDESTKRKLAGQFKHARSEFGDRFPDSLRQIDVEDWRERLPPGSRHDVFRAFRQALRWAVARGLADRDPSAGIRNPKRKRHERRDVRPFESWEEVEQVAVLDSRYRAIPFVAVGCGLRPEELFGLHRGDVDRNAGILHVRRRYTGGVLKEGGKTAGSVRTVPLRKVVLDALDTRAARIDTPILFPAPRGGYIDIEKFRYREWTPAVRAAGVEHRCLNDCRHTFATWAIEAGVQALVSRHAHGNGVTQLEDTYARWLKRTDDQLRTAFDAYDARRLGQERARPAHP
jgi:integrase